MPDDQKPDLWVRDREQDTAEIAFRVEKTLFSRRSAFQQVDIVQSCDHGLILLNDGVVMLTERDEFIYHEMIAHVPVWVHPAPEAALVIGGGDGGTVRELLKHPTLKRVVLVEIDEVVVEACRAHFPSVRSAFEDPRLEVRFEDGLLYAAECDASFDIVVVDSTDPIGPGAGLFERPFYENIAGLLTADGILVTQAKTRNRFSGACTCISTRRWPTPAVCTVSDSPAWARIPCRICAPPTPTAPTFICGTTIRRCTPPHSGCPTSSATPCAG